MRFPPDEAPERVAVLDGDVAQRPRGDGRHMACPLCKAAPLAAISYRPTHLPGEFRYDFVVHLADAGDPGENQFGPFRQGPGRPFGLRGTRPVHRGTGGIECHGGAFGINRPVDG